MKIEEAKWELKAEGRLSLQGTQVEIVYGTGLYPYHVHREHACHAACEGLKKAKEVALEVVAELIEMGIDP